MYRGPSDFVALSKVFFFHGCFLRLCSANILHNLVCWIIHGFPLSLLSSIYLESQILQALFLHYKFVVINWLRNNKATRCR